MPSIDSRCSGEEHSCPAPSLNLAELVRFAGLAVVGLVLLITVVGSVVDPVPCDPAAESLIAGRLPCPMPPALNSL